MASRKPARSTARRAPALRPDAGRPGRSVGRSTGRAHLVFGRRNYVLLLGSIGLIALGYVLMAADNARGVDAQGVHLSLHSALSLTVAPLLLLAGYLGIVGAILWRPKADEEPAPVVAAASEAVPVPEG